LSATKQDVVLHSLSKTYLYSKVYVCLPTEFLVLFITVIVNEYSYSDRRNNTGWDICLIKFRYDIANTIFFETSETIVCTCSCATISSLHVYFLSEMSNHVNQSRIQCTFLDVSHNGKLRSHFYAVMFSNQKLF